MPQPGGDGLPGHVVVGGTPTRIWKLKRGCIAFRVDRSRTTRYQSQENRDVAFKEAVWARKLATQ